MILKKYNAVIFHPKTPQDLKASLLQNLGSLVPDHPKPGGKIVQCHHDLIKKKLYNLHILFGLVVLKAIHTKAGRGNIRPTNVQIGPFE